MGTGDTGNFEKSLMKKDSSASKIMATAQANNSEILESSSNADIVLKGTSNSHPSQEAFSSKKCASKCSSGTGTGGYNDYDQEILKSKILLQWTCHYLWYGILLVGLHYTRWIYLFFWSLPTYAFISFVNLQLSRLLYKHNPSSVVPLYLSYIPFVTFFILSRQVHMVFSLLWFISVMAINLQLGSAKSKLHIVLAVAVFMVLYLLLAGGIKFMRSDPSRSDASGKTYVLARNNLTAVGCTEDSGSSNSLYAIRDNPERCAFEIKFLEELIFCFGGILVGVATFTLQDFIQEYAKSLLDRRNKVKNLEKINADLKSKLQEQKGEVTLDLDSPITKVIMFIKNIQNQNLDLETMENLEHVIEILSSNELFLPNLNNKDGIDSDVNKWLNNMVSNTDSSKKLAHSILTNEIRAMASQGALSEILIKEILPNSAAIDDVLKGFESWDFNIFELADVTGGRPLFFLAYHIFGVCGFKEELQIEDSVLRNFLTKIESGYKPNPYHNSIHAADVMHAVYYFVYSLRLDELLTYEDCFSIIVAAIIHDFDHPGKTNAFLINNSDYLAIRYNDLAVLEHYHCAKAFELILDDANECNIFSNLPNEKFKPIRSSILSMVLATDMASHFEYIAKFKNKTSSHGLDIDDVKDRQLVMDIAIKCGDISNPSKNTDLCSKWADRIMEEFYNQGDAEKEKKIPVSMFMDRNTSVVYKCQIAFIDYLVTPLYEVWDSYINEDETFPGYANIGKSKEFWKKKQDEETSLAVPEK